MGFDVNFNQNQKPVIKETHATQDGGAGNTGYFEQKKKQSDKDKSIFTDTDATDTFGNQKLEQEDDFSISKFIAQLILDIKDWLNKVFRLNLK